MKKNAFITVIIILLTISCSSREDALQDDSGKNSIAMSPVQGNYFYFHEFGTRMYIPEKWRNDVRIQEVPPKNYDRSTAEFDVTFTGSSGKENEFLGAIYIFTETQWNTIPPEWKRIYAKIGEAEGHFYYYKSNQSNPYDPVSVAGREYESRVIKMPNAANEIHIEKTRN